MTDSEISRRKPGRPRAFDEAVVLGAAMRLFWRNGYSRVSVPEISAATGLSTSSLYNAYGPKLDLLVAALDHYSDTVLDGYMLGPLARGADGLADIDAFLDRLAAAVESAHPWGCLAVNTIAEFRDPPAEVAARTARYRNQLHRGLHAALSRASGLGEVPADAVDRRADALVPIVVAFNLLVVARAPATETHDLLAAARTLAHGGLP
ncbi:MAG: TetR/AcrR family transcriptional regulator, transcriptional repressor for nem operon [Pseudonocardiales bacterium]|jgi:TetR/AcrR family transcriptional repressor of nem operon|nr:TetR/AcrR family transcriptional regulator, transcriptional repressor for nem operon [Pseudonocardiales bacterium]